MGGQGREVREMKILHMIAYILLFIGGLNWGLVGLFHWNLVSMLFGAWPMLESLIYILVGVAAVYAIFTHKGDCMVCSMKTKGKK